MCEFCNNIPTYPKINKLSEDMGISIYEGYPSIICESYNLLVHTTKSININYCPICGKKIYKSKMDEINTGIRIFTDGAYRPSVDQGGWSIVVVKDGNIIDKDFNGKLHTTNNVMELTGVLKALSYIIKHRIKECIIYTDSQYVWGCATQNWNRKQNQQLWDMFDKLYDALKRNDYNIDIKWCKGHADNMFNNKADELAVRGSKLVL